jgi:uncharacterized protein
VRAMFLTFGALFGFLLSRARATDYDAIVGMFQFTDLHLMGVMGVGITTAGVGLLLLRRGQAPALTGDHRIEVRPKPMRPRIFVAGLVFGAGWGLSGACPGTALSQVGEGKLYALFTVAGLLAGTYLFGITRTDPTVGATSGGSQDPAQVPLFGAPVTRECR